MAQEEKKNLEELLENPEALSQQLGKTEDFIRNNRKVITYALGGLVLLIAGWFGFKFYMEEQEVEAQEAMFPAVFYFESDSLNKALKGFGPTKGLLTITEDYSGTKAANLAHFYIGVIYLKQGKFDDAISNLESFSADDILLQPRAYSLLGDAHLEKGEVDEAESWYRKASEMQPNKYFTPIYLLKLATVLEKKKDYAGASEAYNTIITKFYDSQVTADARKYKERADMLAGQ
jgi:predicted negative regulator of RcsB-dependent stress response